MGLPLYQMTNRAKARNATEKASRTMSVKMFQIVMPRGMLTGCGDVGQSRESSEFFSSKGAFGSSRSRAVLEMISCGLWKRPFEFGAFPSPSWWNSSKGALVLSCDSGGTCSSL